MTLSPGNRLGPYEITAAIGAGGMGEVYKAQDTRLGRTVAIKFPKGDFSERFAREAKTIAALNHPHICSVHDIGTYQGADFLVMEYVEGTQLGSPHPVATALGYTIQIVDALRAAHQKGIIHRDLKPANIMVTPEGQVKVLDFGLAKHLTARVPIDADAPTATAPSDGPSFTGKGVVVGTVSYMSPEQVEAKPLDARSDIFSFGAVLYELLTGQRAFEGDSTISTMSAILRDTPARASKVRPEVPHRLEAILDRCLQKDREQRYGSAADLHHDLVEFQGELVGRSIGLRGLLQPRIALPASLVLAAAIGGAAWFGVRSYRANWAREVALPEIARLTEIGESLAAFNLATEAEKYLPEDSKALAALRPLYSRLATTRSDPPGATVWWKDYAAKESDWKPLGQTPISGLRVPAVFSTLRLEKEGYEPLLVASSLTQELSLTLERTGSLPKDMVRVPASVFRLPLPGLDHLKEEPLGTFLIDQYEVTNRAYKSFIDGGGYRDKKYWKHSFVENGRMLSWEEAMNRFKDRTGRTGPATWEAGDYPEGQDEYPVSGVSWYEAAAYAEYVGKNLPTIYQWYTAAGMASSAYIVPLSNLGVAEGPAAVGSYHGLGPFGTYDMAGNVREWCRNNSSREGQHFILGGGWNDPPYGFDNDAVTQPSFDRSASNGFRCIKYLGGLQDEAASARTIGLSFRDFFKEAPSSDEEFEAFVRQYAYDPTPLNVEVIAKDTSAEEWTREKVSFDAVYANQRVIAHVFLPKHGTPPYQAVVFWPGDSGLQLPSSDTPTQWRNFDFVIKSGRAVLFPVFRSMFERRDGLESTVPNETNAYKEHVIMWVKDLRRSIDYLQTRPDIDTGKLAYFGFSWGGRMAGIALAVENRFKTAVLGVAGFRFPRSMPEVDPFNFVPRVRIPVIMLNGRYDHYFPVATAQKPMFMLLGTPNEDKKWIVYDGGHFVPREQLIKETLAWLDRYLGSVK